MDSTERKVARFATKLSGMKKWANKLAAILLNFSSLPLLIGALTGTITMPLIVTLPIGFGLGLLMYANGRAVIIANFLGLIAYIVLILQGF